MIRNRHGFTLIELIIVVIIIGILASVAAPMMQTMKNRAIISEALSALGSIRAAARNYYIEYGVYPPTGQLSNQYVYKALGIDWTDYQGYYFNYRVIGSSTKVSCYNITPNPPNGLYYRCYLKSQGSWYTNNPDAQAMYISGNAWIEMLDDGSIKAYNMKDTGY